MWVADFAQLTTWMAVFGVPVAHEDDGLWAGGRAAMEMREALPALGVQARIGVNTGEVVTRRTAGHGLATLH